MIRPVSSRDMETITAIYNHYIANTVVSLEEEPIAVGTMAERVDKVRSNGFPWLVAEHDGAVIGYAYANYWQLRSAYRHSAEVTAYLSNSATRQGWGSQLYTQLFETLRKNSIHVVIAGVSLPNAGSVALHEKFGMKKVAHFNQVGYKFGHWVDVGYWQGTL